MKIRMKPEKLNCWEYKHCGREQGGKNCHKDGVCPAAADQTFHTFNHGLNSGRACWLVAGTFCDNNVAGTFADKIESCRNCDFYKMVQNNEHAFSTEEESIRLYAATHMGLVRKANEDRYLVKKFTDGTLLLAVADGMGGHSAGDYAAEILRGRLANMQIIPVGREAETLSEMAVETDKFIIKVGGTDEAFEGMGTTLLCVFIRDCTAHWVHVGDSRFSIFRKGRLLQITQDQNLARILVEEGEITIEEVAEHYSRNILDQAVGSAMEDPETGREDLKDNDILILSTDGFHNLVMPETIISQLKRKENLNIRADSLINLALEKGGTDNITIVIADLSVNPPTPC